MYKPGAVPGTGTVVNSQGPLISVTERFLSYKYNMTVCVGYWKGIRKAE